MGAESKGVFWVSARNVWEGRKEEGRSESVLKVSSYWGEGEGETERVAGRMVHFSVGTVTRLCLSDEGSSSQRKWG